MTRQMALVGFLQAQNCTNLPSSWRHPESRDDSMSSDYYQEIGRILESGKFHMAFFDDRLAMPDRYGNDHAHTVEFDRATGQSASLRLDSHLGRNFDAGSTSRRSFARCEKLRRDHGVDDAIYARALEKFGERVPSGNDYCRRWNRNCADRGCNRRSFIGLGLADNQNLVSRCGSSSV
jgi:hypothetical protein